MKENLLVSVGGKFTTARQDAAIMVKMVASMIQPISSKKARDTSQSFFPYAPLSSVQKWREEWIEKCQHVGIDKDSASLLLFRYGTECESIYTLMQSHKRCRKPINETLPFVQAEIIYAIEKEMAIHLEDIMRRRIPLVLLARLSEKEIRKIANLAAKFLGWNKRKRDEEVASILMRNLDW